MKFKHATLLAAISFGLATGSASATTDDSLQIATDAYIYGYSLMTTEVTRVQMSNVAEQQALKSPMGLFTNVKRYPPGDFRGVSAPNADTLYSLAWLDLTEPQVFSQPDMAERYFLFPFTDLWMTDFYTPGTRSTGQKAHDFLVTGPGWKGEVPEGMTHVPVDTRYTVILGRIYADGTDADYAKANALQAQLKITPLSSWGKPFTFKAPAVYDPGFSMTDAPQKVIEGMGVDGYFNRLVKLMCKDAPPAAADAPMLEKMATLGIVPCQPFDMSKLDPALQTAMQDLPQKVLKVLAENKATLGTPANGWIITKNLGVYGTDYLKRAVVAAFGWPANLQEDAVYPQAFTDSDGQPLNGANKYTLTFAKGQTPPVNAFWSITMYQIDQGWWFVPNPLNKFTVSMRDNPTFNADGSLTLYFQNQSPGKDKEANWLPAPKGDFLPMLRMYWPKESNPSILDGSWTPPQIIKTR